MRYPGFVFFFPLCSRHTPKHYAIEISNQILLVYIPIKLDSYLNSRNLQSSVSASVTWLIPLLILSEYYLLEH